MNEWIEGLDNVNQVIIQMVLEMSEDLRVTVGVVGTEVADLSARLNLTMKAVGNQTLAENVVQFKR